MRIFLSYPHEHRRIAETIRLSLEEGGHEVFFDRTSLAPGEGYGGAIRQQIERSDLFVFLLSPESVQTGRFILTELGLAEQKWRIPHQHVLPVLIAPVPLDLIPPFLAAVSILEPRGDVAAEVANQVEALVRRLRARRRARAIGFALAALGLLAVPGLLYLAWRERWMPPRAREEQPAAPSGAVSGGLPAARAVAIAGDWDVDPGEITGDLPSHFLFTGEGAELSGFAFYGGQARRILEGKISGDKVTFSTRRSYLHDGQPVEETDRYQGEISGGEIAFLRTVERRDTVIEMSRFTASRSAASRQGAERAPGIGCSFGDELGRLEVRDEDASREATIYLICRLKSRGGLPVGEEGVSIDEEPFGHRLFFSTEVLVARAKELRQKGWECGEYRGDGPLVKSGAAAAGAPRYVFCQRDGKPVSLELRVAPRKADGSLGPDRRLVVKLSE